MPKAKRDFCSYCGAGMPPHYGEGTCPRCDPDGTLGYQGGKAKYADRTTEAVPVRENSDKGSA